MTEWVANDQKPLDRKGLVETIKEKTSICKE